MDRYLDVSQVSQLLSASFGGMIWSLCYCCCTHPVTEDDKNADTVWVFFEKEATVKKTKKTSKASPPNVEDL